MSLLHIFDELLDPHEQWARQSARLANTALANCQKQLTPNPHVDLYPVEKGLELKADLPGMDKESVNLSVEQNVLTLTGERKSETVRDEDAFHYAERRFGQFTRRFKLPYNADPATVAARFENGVLTVSIPQPQASKAGAITIN